MEPIQNDGVALNIGTVAIDPTAELSQGGSAVVSGKQEEQFFKEGGEQFRLAHNQQNLGYLGQFFGANSSAPMNIAGFVIVLSVLFLMLSLLLPGNAEVVEVRKLAFGLISTALAFIFGAASKK